MACNAAFSTDTANQMDRDHNKSLCQLHTEADQAWKDTNDVISSHQLRYDSQLAAFISTAEGTLQAKLDEIWGCIHSLADVASLLHKACLTLAWQILDKLPTIPLDLFYCTAIPKMLTYCIESYTFQTWSATGDGDYFLDDNALATSLLTQKLVCMAGGANLDDRSPAGLLLQLVQLVLPCSALQGAHPPIPTPGLQQTERKGAGLDPTLHPASFLRRASQNPVLPLTLLMAVVAAQHLKMAVSLKARVRQAPTLEPQTAAEVQMMKAPAAAGPAAEEQWKMRVFSRTAQTMKVWNLIMLVLYENDDEH